MHQKFPSPKRQLFDLKILFDFPRAALVLHTHTHHMNNDLVEETNDLAGNVLPPGLLVVHDTSRGGEDNVAELTGGKELGNPLLNVAEAHVVAGRDAACRVSPMN